MDLGAVGGFNGLLGEEEGPDSGFAALASSYPEPWNKLYGSGLILKQEERSGTTTITPSTTTTTTTEDDDWRRSIKMAKTTTDDNDFKTTKRMILQQRSNGLVLRSSNSSSTLFTEAQPQQQQMLCFSSSPKSETMFMERSSQSAALPYIHHAAASPTAYGRNTGYNSGSLSGGGNILTGVRGPFTQSQWMELEHQALVYKYITANMPIPSNLLNPIKRALESVAFSPFSAGSLRPSTLGWGSFHLGFSNSNDPEPGRCRRTDGKKWRCSRDAVADQKYCERHMNRGRHRSRKPVEGQTGHSAARNTTTATRLMPVAPPLAPVVAAGGSGSTSNSLANAHQEVKNSQPCGTSNNPSAVTQLNSCRIYQKNKENVGEKIEDMAGLSILPPTINMKPKDNPFSISKWQASCEESSRSEFGLVSSGSFLNPSHKSLSFIGTPQDLNDQEPESQHSLRPFIDNWSKNHSDRSSIFCPDIGLQSNPTQLSISIPFAPSTFMSTSSSPTNYKVTLSPLRLSCEINPIQMGLGVGNIDEPNHKQGNWIPTAWGASVGGPLGEVLHSTYNSSAGDCKNSSDLNLMMDGWEGSPRLGWSPTGVLQKTTFGCLSNSSAGSSPRRENNKNHQGASSCNDLLGTTTHVISSSLSLMQ